MRQRLHSTRRIPIAMALAFLTLAASKAVAETVDVVDDPVHPLWTLKPTRIDRSKQTYERVKPEEPPAAPLLIAVTPPIDLKPDATFRAGDRQVQLSGLILPDRQKLCDTETGGRWACGIRAQARLAALLTQTPLQCTQLNPVGSAIPALQCASNGTDIATKVLSEGWADPSPDASDDLKRAASEARAKQRGLWSTSTPQN